MYTNTTLSLPPNGRKRRRYAPEFKAAVIAACQGPGVSIASVALANGLNANMLRKWVNDANASANSVLNTSCAPAVTHQIEQPVAPFIPLALPAATPAASTIEVLLRAPSGLTIDLKWPASATEHCASLVRDLLR